MLEILHEKYLKTGNEYLCILDNARVNIGLICCTAAQEYLADKPHLHLFYLVSDSSDCSSIEKIHYRLKVIRTYKNHELFTAKSKINPTE